MGWIEKYKGAGPWPFIEQKNKWGYLNNPRWSNHPKGAADSMSASEFCEGSGLPNLKLNRSTHEPCGHWHKNPSLTISSTINIGPIAWWQPSVDVREGIIGVVPERNFVGDPAIDGIVALTYDVATEAWTCLGYENVLVIYGEPQTARLAENYMAYYCMCLTYDWSGLDPSDPEYNKYYGRLYVFEEGQEPRYTDVWECNYDTGDPYEIYENCFYNKMDCAGDRIACLAWVFEIAGVTYNRWMIKVSNDAGLTFPVEWSFPDVYAGGAGTAWNCEIRMSEDGIIWACYVYYTPTSQIVQLWKSNAEATSMTKIWEKDYYSDTGTKYCSDFGFDISNKDGQYITISLRKGPSNYYDRIMYVSSDYGVNFTTKTVAPSGLAVYTILTSEKQYINVCGGSTSLSDYGFARSTDYGANFSFIDDGYGIKHFFADMQKHLNEIAYIECGKSYAGDDYQWLLYSNDNGETWQSIETPVNINDLGDDIIFESTAPGEQIDEPQVWPMD